MRKEMSDISVQDLLKGKKIPILVLDQRWHKLFPGGRKTENIVMLEKELNQLIKEQAKTIQTLKELKSAKKSLMDAIVSVMSSQNSERKRERQQKLLLETNERIEQESTRLMQIPHEIKSVNELLLITGIQYCYNDWQMRTDQLEYLTEEIEHLREELKEKVANRVDLEESIDMTYSLMHDLVGREVMNLFDKNKT